jgi:hypothetical protein
MRELKVGEVDPENFVRALSPSFLGSESDDWIIRLYGFLAGQQGLWRAGRLRDKEILRLEDGTHVPLMLHGQVQAFLPGVAATGFPTVRRAVCQDEAAREFLLSYGLTEPDPVDDVIRNILPSYTGDSVDVSDEQYESDMARILAAFSTDSKSRKDALVTSLRQANCVMSFDAGDGEKYVSKPSELYLPSQRLRTLFFGVPDVLFVDDSYACLRGEEVRDLLEACGAARYLQTEHVESRFTWQELVDMRTQAGAANSTSADTIEDWTLRGLNQLLDALPSLTAEKAAEKASLLWEALCDVEDRRGSGAFSGTYKWFYFHQRSCQFDALFVRVLNERAWIVGADGTLVPPSVVLFEGIEPAWKQNAFLTAKIRFRPPAIEALAREAGLEPGLLDLLKNLGLTSEADLKARLGIVDKQNEPAPKEETEISATPEDSREPASDATSEPGDASSSNDASDLGASSSSAGAGSQPSAVKSDESDKFKADRSDPGQSATKQAEVTRDFVSYVAVAHEEEADPDGLDHGTRMALEEQAIMAILAAEPTLQRTPANNPGFDLFQPGENGEPAMWVEVKAMSRNWSSRPVGLSRTQFHLAVEKGAAYWLYVVENAGTGSARVLRVQDPAGKSRTFTFDHGWLEVAYEQTVPKY